jgi:3-oxoacyl-[acyl-carrier protein] reductase
MRLDDKIALITGASRGIGKATAIKFSQLGAYVIINYSSSDDEASKVLDAIEKEGIKAFALKADVSNKSEVDSMFESIIKTCGRLDILVNNAGITKDGLLIRMTERDWDKVIDVNLKGVYNCTKEASKIMIKNRCGKIINISSVVGLTGNAGQSNYAAAKAGIIGFSKSIAKELASRGINVNVIAPGFIETDMTGKLSEQTKAKILSNIPLGKYGSADDVAYLASFLASDLSSYITGQVFNVDGGMVL